MKIQTPHNCISNTITLSRVMVAPSRCVFYVHRWPRGVSKARNQHAIYDNQYRGGEKRK